MTRLILASLLAAGCGSDTKTSQADSGAGSAAVSFGGVLDALAGQVLVEHFNAFEAEVRVRARIRQP